MKLVQLRSFCEIIDCGLNVSRAASKLHTVASGLSKQLRLLEDSIGSPLLERKGTRITGVTPVGLRALPTIRRMLNDAERLKRITAEFDAGSAGSLTIATTHINARYTLLPVFQQFIKLFPNVDLLLRQGTPAQIAAWVLSGDVDVGIGTAPSGYEGDLVRVPCYEHEHSVIVPIGHSLEKEKRLTLEKIANYPFIANYPDSRLGRILVDAFEAKGLAYKVAIRATDPSIIKKYVEAGFGIAVLPSITVCTAEDPKLAALRASHLFKSSTACVLTAKGHELPDYGARFIEMVFAVSRKRK